MPTEVWSVLLGTVVGFVLSGALSVWLHFRQRKDGEVDWRRNNRKEAMRAAQQALVAGLQGLTSKSLTEDEGYALLAQLHGAREGLDDAELTEQMNTFMGLFLKARADEGITIEERDEVFSSVDRFHERVRTLVSSEITTPSSSRWVYWKRPAPPTQPEGPPAPVELTDAPK